MAKIRVDVLMVERGLVESRSQAQRLIMAGKVRVAGQVVHKASRMFPKSAQVSLESAPQFVSRGGDKLAAALSVFDIAVEGQICADVGASTGGFSDCLLQHGADFVYAIDVGKGILHWKLRQHPQIEVMESTNARYVEKLPQPVGLVTVDVSFISLKVLLRVIKGWFDPSGGQVIALIKPQFEIGRKQAGRGKGVIRDPELHRQVLQDVLGFAHEQGFSPAGLIKSPLLGPKGNVEFLAHFTFPQISGVDINDLVDQVFSTQ
ncbi:MAG: TlyA family RNA methyltransferase [Chloroflexi bacterium]|nr:TlyA family RNA methyltransferase [Chloroflexota bacterium]